MPKQTFERWKQKVNIEIMALVHLGADDLPDYDYYGAYDMHTSPAVVARAAIRASGPEGAAVLRDLKRKSVSRKMPFSQWRDDLNALIKRTAHEPVNIPNDVRSWYDSGVSVLDAGRRIIVPVGVLRTGDPADASGDEYSL